MPANDNYWDPVKQVKRWWHGAACAGVPLEMFFGAEMDPNYQIDPAVVATCYDCPVKWECRLVAFAERDGVWANTAKSWRRDRRTRIFGRIFRKFVTVGGNADDDMESFRYRLNHIAMMKGDVLDNMRAVGFTETEIADFTAVTQEDERALRRVQKEKGIKTGSYSYKVAREGAA